MLTILLAAVGAVALLPARAFTHEFWLSPSSYHGARGDTLQISASVGTGFRGERVPYPSTRTRSFTLRGARVIDLRPATMNGELAYARFVAADAGGFIVAYESGFTPLTSSVADFDRYLALEGLDRPGAARAKQGAKAGPGRERYARCAKTWIAGSDPARALRAAGLQLEIVPLSDPAAWGPLRLRVLYRGRPLAGALVRAWNTPLQRGVIPHDAASRDSVGTSAQVRTDGGGVATITLGAPGEWLLSAVHMVPSPARADADWESYWASLTFARGAGLP